LFLWEDLVVGQTRIPASCRQALVVLASLYAWKTERKPRARAAYKKKLFELAYKKGFDSEKLIKLLIFVFDFVHLSPTMENEFLRDTSDIIFPSIDTVMETSAGVKKMADLFYQRAYGINPQEEREAAKRERKAAVQREREATKREREATKREREATKREREAALQREREVIFRLHLEAGMNAERIAGLLGHTTEFVTQIIDSGKQV
jgi:hypothetical protein